jgi:hypothetical protein
MTARRIVRKDDEDARSAEMRPLSRQEIDDRIHRLADEVLVELRPGGRASGDPGWIEPGELVRRLRPFVSSN